MSAARETEIREQVRRVYGEAALRVIQADAGGCCGSTKQSCCDDAIVSDLYDSTQESEVPEAAMLASLGCGNPTALAELKPGEIVLDLGSGGGIDVLLSAKRVGPTGFAYGLDMTDEMLALAEKNRAEAGAENVRFLKGTIEQVPLPDASVDVVISNCVINLSADRDAVLREAFRVPKPVGRFAVPDIVTEGDLPESLRGDMDAYAGCIAGAPGRDDYLARLGRAGFEQATVTPTRRYTCSDALVGGCCMPSVEAMSDEERANLNGGIMSAFIRSRKRGTE